MYCAKVVLITCRVAEFPKVSLLFHSWCVSKVMLTMRNNRSTAIFGRSSHPPEGYIAADVRKKVTLKFVLNIISDEIRGACSSVMVTASTTNPFTEQNTEFLYRE